MDSKQRGNVRVQRGAGGRFQKRAVPSADVSEGAQIIADIEAAEAGRISAGPDSPTGTSASAEEKPMGNLDEAPPAVPPASATPGLDSLAAEAARLDVEGATAFGKPEPEAAVPAGTVTVQVEIAMTGDTLRKILKAISDNKMRRDPLTSDELDLLAQVWEKPVNMLYEEMMRWAEMTPEQMGKWGPVFAAASVTVGVALPRVLNRIFIKDPAAKEDKPAPRSAVELAPEIH